MCVCARVYVLVRREREEGEKAIVRGREAVPLSTDSVCTDGSL